ncbi:hypothetical protein BDN72DRAFT_876821 [Pluteus cervinus]|uniref:Uncharacterized protein n=1 Tax=Pluteus cervinus TaxID=181527 RepID=A0ACD3B2Z1_9AGAR|nr:hypothetical protein BDN72DRAFT_876821 [Pluteus cervinus]
MIGHINHISPGRFASNMSRTTRVEWFEGVLVDIQMISKHLLNLLTTEWHGRGHDLFTRSRLVSNFRAVDVEATNGRRRLTPALVKQPAENSGPSSRYRIKRSGSCRDLDPDHRKLKKLEVIKESAMWMELMDQEECWIGPYYLTSYCKYSKADTGIPKLP